MKTEKDIDKKIQNNTENKDTETIQFKIKKLMKSHKKIQLKTNIKNKNNIFNPPHLLIKNRLKKTINQQTITNSTTLQSNSKKRSEPNSKTINNERDLIQINKKKVINFNNNTNHKNIKKLFLNDINDNERKYFNNKEKTRNKINNNILSQPLKKKEIKTHENINLNYNNLIQKNNIKRISLSQNLLNNKQFKEEFNLNERNNENNESKLDSINSDLQELKNEKHSKYYSEQLSHKDEENTIIRIKLTNMQKKYIELKGEIDILKKEKDYMQKTINETKQNNKNNIPKLKNKKYKLNILKNNKKIENEKIKSKKNAKEIYKDYKENEKEVLEKVCKIEDYPDIDPKSDRFGMLIDEIIRKAYHHYKNRQCTNCVSLLSKGFSAKKCPIRHHIFKEHFE